MNKLKTFEEYEWSGNKDNTSSIEQLLVLLNDKGVQYQDIYKDKQHLSFYVVNQCEFSITFQNNEVIIIIEVDGFTDTLGNYDTSELETIADIVATFNVEKYKETN